MKKPYIVCHMMTSLDGRIDCAMTEQLPGVQEYYQILEALQAPTTVSGRVTAQLEMALPGDFQAKDSTPVGKEAFSRKTDAPGYEVVADTHGKLLWPDAGQEEKPLLILTSEQVPQEYLTYLDGRNISCSPQERTDRSGPCYGNLGDRVWGGAHGRCGRLRHQHQLSGCRSAGRGQHPHRRWYRRQGWYASGVRQPAHGPPGDSPAPDRCPENRQWRCVATVLRSLNKILKFCGGINNEGNSFRKGVPFKWSKSKLVCSQKRSLPFASVFRRQGRGAFFLPLNCLHCTSAGGIKQVLPAPSTAQ